MTVTYEELSKNVLDSVRCYFNNNHENEKLFHYLNQDQVNQLFEPLARKAAEILDPKYSDTDSVFERQCLLALLNQFIASKGREPERFKRLIEVTCFGLLVRFIVFEGQKPKDFDQLVTYVIQEIGTADTRELRVLVAATTLGRQYNSPLPHNHYAALLKRIMDEIPEDPERIMEYAIAYGCGLWRSSHYELLETNAGWEGVWNYARVAIIRDYILPILAWIEGFFKKKVAGFPSTHEYLRDIGNFFSFDDYKQDIEIDLLSDAERLFTILTRPIFANYKLSKEDHHIFIQKNDDEMDNITITGSRHLISTDDVSDDHEESFENNPGSRFVFLIKEGNGVFIEHLKKKGNTKAIQQKHIDFLQDQKISIFVNDSRINIIIKFDNNKEYRSIELKNGWYTVSSNTGDNSVVLEYWNNTTGTTGFQIKHCFSAWDLKIRTLDKWIRLAIFNDGNSMTLHKKNVNNFIAGIYYNLLSSQGTTRRSYTDPSDFVNFRLRQVSVGVNHSPVIDQNGDPVRDEKGSIFHRKWTLNEWQERKFNPDNDTLMGIGHLVMFFNEETNRFRLEKRMSCSNCDNLYPDTYEKCPICGGGEKKQPKPVDIWIYNGGFGGSLNTYYDDNPNDDNDNQDYELFGDPSTFCENDQSMTPIKDSEDNQISNSN